MCVCGREREVGGSHGRRERGRVEGRLFLLVERGRKLFLPLSLSLPSFFFRRKSVALMKAPGRRSGSARNRRKGEGRRRRGRVEGIGEGRTKKKKKVLATLSLTHSLFPPHTSGSLAEWWWEGGRVRRKGEEERDSIRLVNEGFGTKGVWERERLRKRRGGERSLSKKRGRREKQGRRHTLTFGRIAKKHFESGGG